MSKTSSAIRKLSNKMPVQFSDIRSRIPNFDPLIIFDVGANVGQSCISYAQSFPSARIFAFEPVNATYLELKKNARNFSGIECINFALGSATGTVLMKSSGISTGNQIVSGDNYSDSKSHSTVKIVSGADFIKDKSIDSICYLKVDTEGHDLEVLKGFKENISRVKFIEVEASMNPYNTRHVPFRVFEDMLRENGFYIFKFYEQALEFMHNKPPLLRRANPLFVNGSIVDLSKFARS